MKLATNTKLRYKVKLQNLIHSIKEFIQAMVIITVLFFFAMSFMYGFLLIFSAIVQINN